MPEITVASEYQENPMLADNIGFNAVFYILYLSIRHMSIHMRITKHHEFVPSYAPMHQTPITSLFQVRRSWRKR